MKGLSYLRKGSRTGGFTLVELLVVIVLMAMVMGLVGAFVSRSVSGAELRSLSRDMLGDIRHTRAQAILQKQQQVFHVDIENRTYQAPGRSLVELPEDVEIGIDTARSELTSATSGNIRFFPDGGSTGGRVTLQVNDRLYRVNVAWLTGESVLETDEDTG